MSRYIEVAHNAPVSTFVFAAAESLPVASMRKVVTTADMTIVGTKLAREASVKLKAEEGQRARTDYDASIEARDVNMARLKALRLARAKLEVGVGARPGKTAMSH